MFSMLRAKKPRSDTVTTILDDSYLQEGISGCTEKDEIPSPFTTKETNYSELVSCEPSQKAESPCASSISEKNYSVDDSKDKHKEIHFIREAKEKEQLKSSKGFPQRYWLFLMCFFGFFNLYGMRAIINVTLIAMVKEETLPKDVGELDDSMTSCTELIEEYNLGNTSHQSIPEEIRGNFDWDSNMQHLVIGSFYYGYFLTQIPGGIMTQKYGAKLTYFMGLLVTTLCTLLTPLLAKWSVWALIFARVLNGLGEGVTYPAMASLLARWTPVMERSMAITTVGAGGNTGTFVSMIIAGQLCASVTFGGWSSAYYVFGSLGCVACVLWVFFVYEYPDDHPRVSKHELMKIRRSLGERSQEIPPTPWKAILTSVPMWGLIFTCIGQYWCFYMLLNETPLYLSNVLYFNIEENGVFSALPNIMQLLCSIASSLLSDKIRSKGYIRNNLNRKLFNSIGLYGPAICMIIIPYAGCDAYFSAILFTLAMGFNGCTYSGLFVTHIDMSPEFSGTLTGITNTFANLSGFAAPAFVGWLISSGNTIENWGIAYITSALILTLSGTVYNIFCTSDLQQWSPNYELYQDHEESRKRSLSDLI